MGYDVSRFCGKVHEDIICPICFGVLENPFEVSPCGHIFCEKCIRRWIETPLFGPSTCPIDRYEISHNKLRPAPKFLYNYLNQLQMKCDYSSEGCAFFVKLEDMTKHRTICPLNPSKPVECHRGCGVRLPPKLLLQHKCTVDPCQDAVIWSEILEDAKVKVRRRSYERYQKRSALSVAIKSLWNVVNNWLADPRVHANE